MKKLKFAVGLMLLTIAISIVCLFFITNSAENAEATVKEIQAEVLDKNYVKATNKIKELDEKWNKTSDTLSVIIHHQALDRVKQSIKLMENFLDGPSPELSDFWAESTRALAEIEDIKTTEMPTVANLL